MKKYNFLPGDPDPPGGKGNSSERLSPQAKRLAILGGLAIVLLGGAYLYTNYFRDVSPPLSPPTPRRAVAPPPKPIAPPQVKPEAAVKAPTPTEEKAGEDSPQRPVRAVEAPREAPKRPEAPPPEGAKPGGEGVGTAEKPPTPTRAAKASRPEVQAGAAEAKGEFAVQVASLVLKQNAGTLEKRLEELGYTPVVHMNTATISRHRVYGGEFSSRQDAERTARRLNVDGFPSSLVEGEDGKFRVEVGSYYNLNKAIDLAHTLQAKRYTPKIHSEAVPTPVYQVRVGEYASRAQALKVLEALKKQGFTPIVVKR